MSVVWLILKILGLTLAGVLALFFIALFIPAVLEISYRSKKLNITLKYLFLRFRLWGADTAKTGDDAPEADKEADGTEKKKKVKLDAGLIMKLLEPGGRAVWYIVRRLRIYDIRVRAVARGEDCAAVGVNAGRTWAAIGAIAGAVNGIWPRARVEELTVIPDFAGEHVLEEKYSCKIAALPIIIGIAGIRFIIKYVKISNEREKEKVEKETQEKAGAEIA